MTHRDARLGDELLPLTSSPTVMLDAMTAPMATSGGTAGAVGGAIASLVVFWALFLMGFGYMRRSPFYHRLHIVQLRVMHRLTGEDKFAELADRWESYARSRAKRARALCYKSAFKLCYY